MDNLQELQRLQQQINDLNNKVNTLELRVQRMSRAQDQYDAQMVDYVSDMIKQLREELYARLP